jgi:Zn finger protein HypA/HybF involved in hydrogenase expression
MFFAMRHEVAENRIRKTAKYEIVPEDVRCACLKCGGMAKKFSGGSAECRICTECGFEWEVDNNVMSYRSAPFWKMVPAGLMLVLWEKEL